MAAFRLPRVIGHRGAAAHAPENTLEGIREAARRGARWVEFDAKLTGDGVVILMHDDTLDRTTNGRGPVARTSFADIGRLDAGAWFGEAWRGARVPSLADTLALLVELDMQANIEIKPCAGREVETARAVVEVVERHWPGDRALPLLSSFSRPSLEAARVAAPAMPRGLLIWEFMPDWAAAATALACVTIHCSDRHLTPNWAVDIRRAAFGLAAYTVNDAARALELEGWGVQCLFTDRPDTIIAAQVA
ncbi:MAG TPA: glycerophosphodiester phosphodiesterase [Candidatus Acidoferrum sp.]|nr:glycerophosphodiester phosphodiesterase [Candidatus Acidoferrum sp.]